MHNFNFTILDWYYNCHVINFKLIFYFSFFAFIWIQIFLLNFVFYFEYNIIYII